MKFLKLSKGLKKYSFLIEREMLIAIFLVAIGFFLRFYNLDWDSNLMFHPDERNIANAVTKITFFTKLDPEFFAYGSFTIYLYRLAADLFAMLTSSTEWTYDWGKINLAGRYFSAFFSSLTIFPLYFLAKNISNRKVALLSIIIFSLLPSSIQNAHFSTTESLLTLLIISITYVSVLLVQKRSITLLIALGILLGISLATKTSALTFFSPLLVMLILASKKSKDISKSLLHMLLVLLTAGTLFLVLSPYTIISWEKFLESMNYEYGVVKGTLEVVYTLQFNNTFPVLYQLKNLIWQMGPIGLLSIPSLLFFLNLIRSERRNVALVSVSFPILYFLSIATWHTKFIRYMIPLLPFLSLFIGYFLWSTSKKFGKPGTIILLVFVILTILSGLSFSNIYFQKQTRIAASEWIYKNIPNNSVIKTEHWDDGLPVAVDGKNSSIYESSTLSIYDNDDKGKLQYFGDKLSETDYIIINSRRLYGTLIRLKSKYPITSKYYELLFDEKLGFKKIAEFSSYPNFLGIEINDDDSEETFQVYDHPKVIIFKNMLRLDNDEIISILGSN